MSTVNYLSLYDYLGRAAGPDLGLEVEKEARNQGITVLTKTVSTKNYSGKINMYPESFLKDYFKLDIEGTDTTILYNEPDSLPADYNDELPF